MCRVTGKLRNLQLTHVLTSFLHSGNSLFTACDFSYPLEQAAPFATFPSLLHCWSVDQLHTGCSHHWKVHQLPMNWQNVNSPSIHSLRVIFLTRLTSRVIMRALASRSRAVCTFFSLLIQYFGSSWCTLILSRTKCMRVPLSYFISRTKRNCSLLFVHMWLVLLSLSLSNSLVTLETCNITHSLQVS